MKNVFLAAISALALSSSFAAAHSIDQRRFNQAREIEQGREDGSITWREGHALRREQANIGRAEAAFRSDGRLTWAERQELRRLQSNADRHIAHEENDGWHRPWWLPRFGL